MDIQNKEALIAEIEQFKEEALKMHIVQVLADSYTNTNLFDYNIDSDSSVIWYKAQARQLWDFWQAKAQAVPAQLDVNSILHDIDCYFDNGLSNTERTANNLLQSIYEKLSGEVKAQEQKG